MNIFPDTQPSLNNYRSLSTRASGVLVIVVGIFLCLISFFWWITGSEIFFRPLFHYISATVFLALGILGIATGLALYACINWARIVTIIFAIALISPPPFSASNWISTLFEYLPFLFIGLWWLIHFSTHETDLEFSSESPALITAVAWLLILQLTNCFSIFFSRTPFFIAGHQLVGKHAEIASIIFSICGFIGGIALLRKYKWGYWLALSYYSFFFVSTLINDFSPQVRAATDQIVLETLSKAHLSPTYLPKGQTFSFIDPLILLICLGFLWPKYDAAIRPKIPQPSL